MTVKVQALQSEIASRRLPILTGDRRRVVVLAFLKRVVLTRPTANSDFLLNRSGL